MSKVVSCEVCKCGLNRCETEQETIRGCGLLQESGVSSGSR